MLDGLLAYLNRSGGRLPRPRFTLGATANTCGNLRSNCGISSSAPLQPEVMKLNCHIASPKQAIPNIISQRVSKRRASTM